MELTKDVYFWLVELKLIEGPVPSQDSPQLYLPEEIYSEFESGLRFVPIIKKIYSTQNYLDRETTPIFEMSSLKDAKSAAARLQNWKILASALSLINITLDADTRSLIVAGDRDKVISLISDLYSLEKSAKPKHKAKKTGKKPAAKVNTPVQIDSLRTEKELSDCETCLEFLLVSFCKHFGLKPKQAAGLLTQSGKYLTYVVSKGLKGKHSPIVAWYSDLYSNLKTLTDLISKETSQGSVEIILSSLQSGFLSKYIETVLWTCRTFARLASDLNGLGLLSQTWDWFVSQGAGLESCLIAYSRFKGLIQNQLVNVLVQFGRNNFTELFTVQLKNCLAGPVEYLSIIDDFLPELCEIKTARDEIQTAGILGFWIQLGQQEFEGHAKLSTSNFLCNIWMSFPSVFENNEALAGDVLGLLKRLWRDRSKSLRFASLSKGFQLLENFSLDRNPYAPIIYKSLTFFLVENYQEIDIRELILYNFLELYEKNPGIPIGILVDPLVKQYQVSNNIQFNTVDFLFFNRISKHEKLTLRQALQTIDVLGKISMTKEVFLKAASGPFILIAKRFLDHSSIQEYLYRLLQYNIKALSKPETIEKTYQVSSLIDLGSKIIKLGNEEINKKIFDQLCQANAGTRRTSGNNSKVIMSLLKLYGEPREIIENWLEQHPESSLSESITDPDVNSQLSPRKALKRQKIATESSTSSLNNYKIMPRAEQDIQRIRQSALEKELKSLKQKKRTLRRQLEQKKVSVSAQSNFLSKPASAQVDYFLILELSDSEKELISILMKRYQRPLKLLFKKYSSTGYSNSVIDKATFENFAEKNSVISDSEMYKLLKEQGITTNMISLEDFSAIMKHFCHKGKKSAIRASFSEFQDLLAQTAIFIYSRSPNDLSHLHPVISVKNLFEHFRKNATNKGIQTKFYDEPDPGVGDREIVKRLNLMLEKNPESELPEGYRKVIENDIEIKFEVPEFFDISEGAKISVSVLDELLFKKFGFRVLEPTISVKSVTRARGVLTKPEITAENDLSQSLASKFNVSSVGKTYKKAVYQPTLPTDLILTPGIKFEIARLTGKYPNDLIFESAKLLDDIIHSVDSKSPILITRNNKSKILNKAAQVKEQKILEKKQEEDQKEEKRKLRSQLLEQKLKKALSIKSENLKKEQEKKKIEDQKRRENLKKIEEKQKEDSEKREKELEGWREKKKQELEKLKNEENLKKMQTDEAKKKKLEDFKARQKIQALEKILEPKQEEKKTLKPNFEKIRKKDGVLIEEQKKLEEKIRNSYSSPGVQEVMAMYSSSIETVFNHFCRFNNSTSLPQAGFNRFCSMFNITSVLISADDIVKIFKVVQKDKKNSNLDLDHFKESIFRLSVVSKEELEKIDECGYLEDLQGFNRFLEYLKLSPQVKITRDLLQSLENAGNKAHPRDKKKFKLNRSESRDKTPVELRLRPLSSRRK